jgi:hypothetical protein
MTSMLAPERSLAMRGSSTPEDAVADPAGPVPVKRGR